MKFTLAIMALAATAVVAVPTPTSQDANLAARQPQDSYGTYNDYPPAPSYSPPAGGSYGTYSDYPTTYSTYTSYTRSLGDLIKRVFKF